MSLRDLDPFEKMARKGWPLDKTFGVTDVHKRHMDAIMEELCRGTEETQSLKSVNRIWKDKTLPLNARLFYIFQFGRYFQSRIHEGDVPSSYLGRVVKALTSFNKKYYRP